MSGVEHMSLGELSWGSHRTRPRPYEPLLLSRFSSLKSLRLDYCIFPSFHFFRRALVALPVLEDLTFFYVSWHKPFQPPSPFVFTHVPTRPELKTLRVFPIPGSFGDPRPNRRPVRWLLHWLTTHTRSQKSIRELEISDRNLRDMRTGNLQDEYSRFLEVVAPHLQILRMPGPLARTCPVLLV
ncbi:hypothetical protein C8T65DRAFT_98456 [Cerioporus squamosus]|nr:hypothetical protein C8T65DRAFT_98456 [Cerioporus squamosus]